MSAVQLPTVLNYTLYGQPHFRRSPTYSAEWSILHCNKPVRRRTLTDLRPLDLISSNAFGLSRATLKTARGKVTCV